MGVRDNLYIYFFLILSGVILEEIAQKLYFRITKKKFKEHHFSLSRYVYLLLFPILAVFVITQSAGTHLFNIFIIFSLVGTLLEWLIGFFYHQIVGQRLWTYHRYSINGYTSLLSLPLWGLAGVLFWLLAKVFA
jgi:uncharacterized membrane protein